MPLSANKRGYFHNLSCLTDQCSLTSVPMLPEKLLRFHCIWHHAALINDLIGIWDMIDQSLSHAQMSSNDCLFFLKIRSVPGQQCEQTLLLCDSTSSVVPSVTFHCWKINGNNRPVTKTTASSLSYEIVRIIFKITSLCKSIFAAPLANVSS